MLTKGRISFIQSLKDKKVRSRKAVFVVEGEKSVIEILKSNFDVLECYATRHFINANKNLLNSKKIHAEAVEEGELRKISFLETPQEVLLIAKQKQNTLPQKLTGKILALDNVRDPGNLGTIIRIADWYGIKEIVCSENCADLWNNKVISASMGSFCRVKVYYASLSKVLSETKLPVLGAFLKGENAHKFSFPSEGILVLGNEANGISDDIKSYITHKITIPRFGEAESLNVSVSGAVLLDNWAR